MQGLEKHGSNGPAFIMDGAREVLSLIGSAPQFKLQVETLEQSIESNPALAIDLAKALVETVCRTIMNDRGVKTEENNPSLGNLLNATLKSVHLVNTYRDDEAEVTKHLRKMSKGMITAFQGLGELRNSQGFASHGPDGYMEALDPIQALFAARSADAIVHFLFRAHKSYAEPVVRENGNNKPSLFELEQEREAVNYNAHEHFNDHIDELHDPLKVFEVEYSASESFARVDPEAYLQYLDGFNEDEYLAKQTEELQEFSEDIASRVEEDND